jgi:prolipoprotein diacylglyceryltransferase
MIRLGNLFNSEILGPPTNVPWAFIFVREDLMPRHPAQLYECLANLFTFFVLLALYIKWKPNVPRGSLLGLFLVMVFAARFFLEFFKERQAAYEQNFAISVGQALSIPFVATGVFLLLRARKRPLGYTAGPSG